MREEGGEAACCTCAQRGSGGWARQVWPDGPNAPHHGNHSPSWKAKERRRERGPNADHHGSYSQPGEPGQAS